MGLPCGKNFTILTSTIFDRFTRVTDGRTHERIDKIYCCCHTVEWYRSTTTANKPPTLFITGDDDDVEYLCSGYQQETPSIADNSRNQSRGLTKCRSRRCKVAEIYDTTCICPTLLNSGILNNKTQVKQVAVSTTVKYR